MKLSADALAKKVQAVYAAKKRDPAKVTTGTDIEPPPFFIPSHPVVQKILGLPGYPGRRIVQWSGKPNSGKTTLGMLAMCDAQRGVENFVLNNESLKKSSVYTILVETEGKFSEHRFKKMGGKPENLLLVSATTLEQGFIGIDEYLNVIYSEEPNAIVLVVWDSLGGTPSEAEVEADADQSLQLAIAAKVIKRNLRVFVTKWLNEKNISMVVINQNYDNIGSVGRSNSGGDGLEYHSSIIVQLSRTNDLTRQKDGEDIKYGITTRAKVTKNHLMTGEYTIDKLDFDVLAYEIQEKAKKEKKEDPKKK